MQFYKKTVFDLFDGSRKQFVIPVYQRAYAWEKEQWATFLNDLLEQLEGQNNYFYGNILLEGDKNIPQKFEVIDGQQRITTLSIFIRALLNVLKDKEAPEIDFKEREKTYIKYGETPKLRPVEYDDLFYKEIIVNNNEKEEGKSPSQKRMLEAKKYFEKELNKLSIEKLCSLFEKLESTQLTTIELKGKKDAALMFELQNNRGKDLTNMEKLKSYFMYQMYVCNDEGEKDTEESINYIAQIFEEIYRTVNNIESLNEDSILIYHNNAYTKKGYAYRTLDDLKEQYKEVKSEEEGISDNRAKTVWIKDYVSELKTTFDNIEKFEKTEHKYAQKLTSIGMPAYAWAFIIRGYKYIGNNQIKLSELFQILEKVIFRAKLINSRANIQERLNDIMRNFEGDLISLNNDIKNKLNNAGYWSDTAMKSVLDSGNMYNNQVLNYLLWEYEEDIQNKGYNIHEISLEREQIEHISPQKPDKGRLATGYSPYNDDFEENFLNCLGNLMLISGSHNASIGNKPFKEKINSYKSNPLLNQQAEIKDFCKQEEKWGKDEITTRKKKILDFCEKRWKF
jgi:hypothetical protein hcinC1_09766